jgi:putative ABC transport system substrate-binding protein
MQRRDFITILGGVAAGLPLTARAQTKRTRIAWFTVAPHPYIEAFRTGLKESGWNEGDNLLIDYVYADGNPERLPDLATAISRSANDLVVASGAAVEAAHTAIQSIPIVGVSSTLGTSGFERRAANLTGIALLFDEVASKWLELLIEAVPGAKRIGALMDTGPSAAIQFEVVKATAARLGRTLLPLPIGNAGAIGDATARARAESLDGLIFLSSPIFTANAAYVAELVQRYKMPAIFEARVLVERGGLLSYGPNFSEVFRRAASLADRILKGAKPGDLPIERPTRFDLAVNLKSAKALGLEVPTSVLLRADEVIE